MRRYVVTVDGTPFTIDIEETAADRFTVAVGDRTFEASLEGAEDLPGAQITPVMPGPAGVAPRVQTAPPPRVPADAAPLTRAPAARGSVVAAPMPGVVLDVLVVVGTRVARGDPLLVLEAMKMRNTIRSPRDGLVAEITTESGRPVVAGEPLVRLDDAANDASA